MARVFEASLSLEGMRKLTKELRHYRKVTLTQQVRNFVEELGNYGILVIAYETDNAFKPYIGVKMEFPDKKYHYQCTGIIVAFDALIKEISWVRDNELITKEVSSILMSEYGSGQYADKKHRGTFPDQRHAFENSWAYATELDADGHPTNWHGSKGVKPTMPMHKAYVQMLQVFEQIAENAFQRTV